MLERLFLNSHLLLLLLLKLKMLLLERGIRSLQRLLQSNHLIAAFLLKRLQLPLQRQLLLQQICGIDLRCRSQNGCRNRRQLQKAFVQINMVD